MGLPRLGTYGSLLHRDLLLVAVAIPAPTWCEIVVFTVWESRM